MGCFNQKVKSSCFRRAWVDFNTGFVGCRTNFESTREQITHMQFVKCAQIAGK